MLEACEGVTEEGKEPYLLFRGTIAENDEDTHSFLEIVKDGGRSARVLIDPSKHLTVKQRRIFASLPEFSREEYELLETRVRTYADMHGPLSIIREMMGGRSDDIGTGRSRQALDEALSPLHQFVLLEFPDRWLRAKALYDEYTANRHIAHLSYEHLYFYEELVREYGNRLFDPDAVRETLQQCLVKLESTAVTFDATFRDDFVKRYEKPDRCDEALCDQLARAGHTIRVVASGDRERNIPYQMEYRAIRTLGLQPHRPLITVIGGCRELGTGGTGPAVIDTMCDQITSAAHGLKANIVPPGTQSGIGVTMGRAAVAYAQRNAERRPEELAKFFAVSPGGETYAPGNPYMAGPGEPGTDVFAIGPFDSVLTPFKAGWALTGEAKEKAEYFQHIEYAEAIYHRLSAGQPRVTVVGDGGLFTVIEACAALKNNSAMLLVRDSGRFADLAIALTENRPALEQARNHARSSASRDQSAAPTLDSLLLSVRELLRGGRPEAHEPPPESWDAQVVRLILTRVPEGSRAALLRAFGTHGVAEAEAIVPLASLTDDQRAEQRLYRDSVYQFFQLSEGRNVQATTVERLEQSIEQCCGLKE